MPVTKLRGMRGVWPTERRRFRSELFTRGLERTLRGVAFGALLGLGLPEGSARAEPVRMEVRQVVVDPTRGTPVVLLAGGEWLLPIWIGEAEAASIARALAGEEFPRPDTHDLIQSVLRGLEAELERVTVTELRDSTFFAEVAIKRKGRRIRLDARPSDAIAVALRTGTPIYATPEVLQQGVRMDRRQSEPRDRVSRIQGLQVQDLTADLARLFGATVDAGALVAHVERDSPAARLGLRRGDVVIRVDDTPVRNSRDLLQELQAPATRPVRILGIQRNGEFVTIMTNPPSR